MPREKGAPPQVTPKSLDDYLEQMTKSAFQSGISWDVIIAGPASNAMPQVGDPPVPRPHATTASSSSGRGTSRFVDCMRQSNANASKRRSG